MSEIDFLNGRTVVKVRDDERSSSNPARTLSRGLYADVGNAVCFDPRGQPLSVDELRGRTVAEVSTTDGALCVAFTDGTTLRSEPDPNVEAWQVVGGTPQALVVCLPGGEVAVVGR